MSSDLATSGSFWFDMVAETISTFQPYPTYKPSGVKWLGDVPAHWEVMQLGRMGKFSKGIGGTKEDEVPEGISCVRYGDLYTSHKFFIQDSRAFITKERALEYSPIEYGDVLFAASGETIEEIGKSAVNLIESQAYCGGDVIRFRPRVDLDARFSGYAIDSPQSQYQKSCMGRGITVMHIYANRLKYLWLGLPPIHEQTAIVRYLDHVDDRIRRYVSAKERLIALLVEERQAVIHRAGTRGLDPNVRLKPSGVKWLGDVPAHWEVMQLGRMGKFSKGIGGTKEDEVPEGISCVRYGDLYTSHKFFIQDSRAFITKERALEYSPIEYGDVLFAASGETIEEIGKSAVNLIESQAYCGGDVIRFRPRVDLDARFSGYAIDSPQSQYQKSCMGRGITVMHIYANRLKYLWLGLPPIHEQTAIVEYLDKTTADIDAAIGRARRQIELLREYRTRLIADVVTGKLDVSGSVELVGG